MPTKFFFPWLQLQQPIDLGEVHLVPYQRGANCSGEAREEQTITDSILGNYGDCLTGSPNGLPRAIRAATIAEWQGDGVDAELDDAVIAERLNLGQWVAFSALSRRRFGSHFGYCNADDLYFVAQCFDSDRANALAMRMRRRDGASVHYVSRQTNSPIFLRPPHSLAANIELDIPLIGALLRINSPDLQERILSAVSVFNRANTDGPGLPQGSEITLMRVAFETLLGTGFRAKAIQDGFSSHFDSEIPNPPVWSAGKYSPSIWRRNYPKNVQRPLDAWAQDFCSVRNSSSHGKGGSGTYPDPIWSIQNHLLFSSWLFPLMVKKLLSDNGLYQLSSLDSDCRARIEEFFAHDILARDIEGRLYWSRVEDDMRMNELGRALRSLV